MKIQILESGAVQFRSRLQLLKHQSPDLLRAALRESSRLILEASRAFVPIDTGHLIQSGFYGSTQGTDKAPTILVGYAAPYAVHVHERTEIPHRIGQAKYLEEPYNRLRPMVPVWVRAYIANRLEKMAATGRRGRR